jgi:hypothetical protein
LSGAQHQNAPLERSSESDYQDKRRSFIFARLYGQEHPALLRLAAITHP